MKISEDTLKVLKSFARVNNNILITSDKTLRTCSMEKNIVGVAEITEEFPVDVPIYDLSQLINTISLFENPDFTFEDSHVIIADEGKKTSCKYYYANVDTLDVLNKTPNVKEGIDEFTLPAGDIKKLEKASSVLGVNDLKMESDGESVWMDVFESKTNRASNQFTVSLGESQSRKSYKLKFKMDLFKLMGGDYELSVAKAKKTPLMQFQHGDLDLFYWICPDPDSEFEDDS